MQPRLLSIVIFGCLTLLVVKLTDIVTGSNYISEWFVSSPKAEDKPKAEEEKPKTEEKADEADKEAHKEEESDKDAKEEGDHKEAKDEHGEKKDEHGAPAEEKKSETPVGERAEKPDPKQPEFKKSEVEILQRLSSRRKILDDREQQIQVREQVLSVTEARIDQKLKDLEAMKTKVEELLNQHQQQEETKLKSLVKIYENMKPKDAARIFEELEMQVLLPVVDRMSERRVAPILANMNPQKAKDVTTELANMRKLSKIEQSGGAN